MAPFVSLAPRAGMGVKEYQAVREQRANEPPAIDPESEPVRAESQHSAEGGPCYLLIFESGKNSLVNLPWKGDVTLGSSAAASVQLRSPTVLPRHATVKTLGREAVLSSLVPTASLRVNDAPLDGAHVLTSGDVIALGDVTVGFHRNVIRGPALAPIDASSLRLRLDDEIERSLRNEHPLALLLIDSGPVAAGSLHDIAEAACRAVRRIDIVAIEGPSAIAVILPETGQSAVVVARRILQAVLAVAPEARGGIAACPDDGCDRDALLTGARAASRVASPGMLAIVSSAAVRFTVGDCRVVVVDPVMKSLFDLVKHLAASTMPVLIHGETGVGKEIVAQALHAWSPQKLRRLVAINCAALPESLLESELFGHERGAFSGAVATKPGLFEQAAGGTVFLDEVGDCSPLTQAKLLRVIETHRVTRLGGLDEHPIDVRVVSATNRALEEEISAGRFRRDLYFRLNAAAVLVPPLRERSLDTPALARAFLDDARASLALPPLGITPGAMRRLTLHSWPGNVRELKNLMDFLAASINEPELLPAHLPAHVAASVVPWMLPRVGTHGAKATIDIAPVSVVPEDSRPRFRNIYDEIAGLERRRMKESLDACGGVRVRAAERIGMPLRTFVTKLKLYGLGGGRSRDPSAEPKAGS